MTLTSPPAALTSSPRHGAAVAGDPTMTSGPRRSTPTVVWAFVAAITIATVLLFVALTTGVAAVRAGTKAIGSDSVPSIDDALDLYTGFSNMDADLANYLLLAAHPSADLSQTQVVADYDT